MLVGYVTLSRNDLFIWRSKSAPTGLCPACLTAWKVGATGMCWVCLQGVRFGGELSWKPGLAGQGPLIHHEAFSEAITGWAKRLCRFDCRLPHHHLRGVGVLITQFYSWGNEVQRSYVTCPRSPGQARKGFSYQMCQLHFAHFAP